MKIENVHSEPTNQPPLDLSSKKVPTKPIVGYEFESYWRKGSDFGKCKNLCVRVCASGISGWSNLLKFERRARPDPAKVLISIFDFSFFLNYSVQFHCYRSRSICHELQLAFLFQSCQVRQLLAPVESHFGLRHHQNEETQPSSFDKNLSSFFFVLFFPYFIFVYFICQSR